jgi:hypothetical protein
MVITKEDIDQLPPAERVKRLRALRMQKRKELDDLQQQKNEELAQAESDLEKSIEELSLEDEAAVESAATKSQQALESSLLEVASRQVSGAVVYGEALDDLMPRSILDLADSGLYREVKRIEEKGYVTPEEQRRLAQLQSQASAITSSYSARERRVVDDLQQNYLSRTEEVLKRLDNKLHDLSAGLYNPNKRDLDAVYQ